MEEAALSVNHHLSALIYALADKSTPNRFGFQEIQAILDRCPESGPRSDLPAETGWQKDNRWICSKNIGDPGSGHKEYNGVDFLLLHNLARIVFGERAKQHLDNLRSPWPIVRARFAVGNMICRSAAAPVNDWQWMIVHTLRAAGGTRSARMSGTGVGGRGRWGVVHRCRVVGDRWSSGYVIRDKHADEFYARWQPTHRTHYRRHAGLGKAIGLEFAKTGATVYLTHRWGSVDEEELIAEFCANDVPPPRIIESDVSNADDTRALVQTICDETGALDIVISNVAFAKTVQDLSDLRKRALDHSLAYSAWPIVDLIQAAHTTFSHYPRYVIGISSDGGALCHPAYDLVGVSKSVLETLCRYLALRLKPHGSCVNAIRPGFIDTASARATFGDAIFERMQQEHPGMLLDPHAVARACVALCSGYMDAVVGQVITVDAGWGLVSPLALLGER